MTLSHAKHNAEWFTKKMYRFENLASWLEF